jgi:cathepsin B
MKFLVGLALFVALASAMSYVREGEDHTSLPITEVLQRVVETHQGLETTWTASVEQGSTIVGKTYAEVKGLMGVLEGGPKLARKVEWKTAVAALPDSFDARDKWPQCASVIGHIRDQSSCGSCWAFAAVEAMSDRNCIAHGNTTAHVEVSAQDMNSCCGLTCGNGCNGGYPSGAWSYWVRDGVVSHDCSPYSLPSCDHHVPNSNNPCPSTEYKTPACEKSCKDTEAWTDSKKAHQGRVARSASGENNIMQEIFDNGPVETAFTVYEDFLAYKTGVYKHSTGSALGGHAVKFLGWGVENGVKYWLVANSWNPTWGDNGFFKIVKGVNNCGIENEVNFGTPL